MRLAMIYALLDESDAIQPAHLLAGLAVWDYAARSVAVLFGQHTGSTLADQVLGLLRAAKPGLTRTELITALGRHVDGESLTQVLNQLAQAGQARRSLNSTGGRPAERWQACEQPATEVELMNIARQASQAKWPAG